MRGTRPKTQLLGALMTVLTAACTATGVGHGPSDIVSPPPPDGASPTPTVSPTPTGSPGPESALEVGVASVTLSGDLTLSIALSSIETPAVWAPPPAPMDITWSGGTVQQLHLSGTSFVSLAPTSADKALSFTVQSPDGPIEFSSTAGECSITITPALADNMGGVFGCTLLTDVGGTVTVDARGTFSASG
jgi:hypothetical protein